MYILSPQRDVSVLMTQCESKYDCYEIGHHKLKKTGTKVKI